MNASTSTSAHSTTACAYSSPQRWTFWPHRTDETVSLARGIPTLGMLGGVPFANRVRPYVLGLPFLLAWIVVWVVITSLVMALIFVLDSRRDAEIADVAATSSDRSSPS